MTEDWNNALNTLEKMLPGPAAQYAKFSGKSKADVHNAMRNSVLKIIRKLRTNNATETFDCDKHGVQFNSTCKICETNNF